MKTFCTYNKWFKVYWELFDDDTIQYQEAFFLCYLIEIFPILKDKNVSFGKEYARLADSFIQEKMVVTNKVINKWLQDLTNAGYIQTMKIDGKKRGIRYYCLSEDLINCLNQEQEEESEEVNNRINSSVHNPANTVTTNTFPPRCYTNPSAASPNPPPYEVSKQPNYQVPQPPRFY